jgi:hypothetical protein
MELYLIAKRTIPVPQQDRECIAPHVRRDKIRDAVLVEIERIDRRRIFSDLIAGKVIKHVRRDVGVLL